MLLLGSSFAKFPILSLRTALPVGSVVGHVINPHKLRVDALWCKVNNSKEIKLLLIQDIREVSPGGIIIDDLDCIASREDVIRLDKIIRLKFELLGKKVISGRLPLGKVVDYALDRDGFLVQKLYVEPSIFGRFKTTRLTVDRGLIVEVSPRYVKVKGGEVKASEPNKLKRSQLSSVAATSASLIEE